MYPPRSRRRGGVSEGLLAEFGDEEALARAAHGLRASGYRQLEAFMPFPSEAVMEALALPRSRLPLFVLIGALLGGSLGYLVMWWTNVVDYDLDVGGRDPHAWPAFIPITFESAILLGGIAAFVGFFVLSRLPRLWHPVFEVPGFERASSDGFFLSVSAEDARFDAERTPRELEEHAPVRVVPFPIINGPKADGSILEGSIREEPE
jgi:hypothetical protein